jgi:hypothetical protein
VGAFQIRHALFAALLGQPAVCRCALGVVVELQQAIEEPLIFNLPCPVPFSASRDDEIILQAFPPRLDSDPIR